MIDSVGIAESDQATEERALSNPGLELAEPAPQTPVSRARTFCELGRFAEAITAVGQVISAEPRNAEAWCLMAQAQLGGERPGQALQAARAAASLDPAGAEPHRLASLALSRLGRVQDAVQAARQATLCDPESWQAQARLAHCLATFRDCLDDARQAAERALALGPQEPGPHLAAGAVALAAGRRADAAAAFCSALAVDPLCSEAHNQLADLQALGPRRRSVIFGPLKDKLARGRRPKGPASA